MHAITGITGKVGREVARSLLAAGQPVRAVMRNEAKIAEWAARGCEAAVAHMEDAAELARAFAGADSVFILPPPEFDPAPGYPEARKVVSAVAAALRAARPKTIVCLSSIGADAHQDNLLSQRTLMEQELRALDIPIAFLRPGWFMENAAPDVPSARETGVLPSFLQPADKAFPMVAAGDVGRLAARLMQQVWTGIRIVELEGPTRVTPNHLAEAFAEVLGRPVRLEIVPRARWEELFRSRGMRNPLPRMRMLDGFNEGWIEFRDRGAQAAKGGTPLLEVIASLASGDGTSAAA